MIKITIPNNNVKERKYILDIIFLEFLNLSYELFENSECKNWQIELKNGTKLVFEDVFFNKYQNDLEYLKLENLPCSVNFIENQYTVENNIPVIYGTDNLEIFENELRCGIDIFASSFFMLTRWEEYVNKNRDNHNRFPAYESSAFKNNFLDRPIVNEYVEMLKNMLLYLDSNFKFQISNYQLMLTHDVDVPVKYTSYKTGFKEIAGDIIKRQNIKLALLNTWQKFKVHMGLAKDPFDTFDYLMTISEKIGVKSYFFFMGKGNTKFDNMYDSEDDFIKELIQKIKKRGHHIGIHPTYNAYNSGIQFAKEKNELEKNLNVDITFGREHFLRFEVPTTWQIWEDNGMKWDSTCSYADKEGFRCGVCYEYSVFNILTRQKLKLKEKPLIVMEGSFATYQPNIKSEEMENKIKHLMGKVKKYNGEFVFLWHNSSFNTPMWERYQKIYEEVLL